MQNPIGILGGTFNPIHNGHLAMAKAALKECNLSKVVFLPNGNPPHKAGEPIVPARRRFDMVRLAIEGMSGFELCDYEINRAEPSYTVDTNRVLQKMYNCPIYFIIGADSLYTLDKWSRYDELVRECSFIVADRNCNMGDDVIRACNEHNAKGGNAIPLSMPPFDVTSTDIRRIIKNGGDASAFLPNRVVEYIKIHGLY